MKSNVLYVYIRMAVTTLLGLIGARLTFQALGQSDYGLYNVVGGIITVLTILSTAMSTTTRRYINVEAGRKDGNLNKVFNICLAINVGFAIVLFILAESIGMWYIHSYLNVSPEMKPTAYAIFHISTLTSALAMVNIPHQSLMAAYERFKWIAVFDILVNVVKLGGVCVLFLFDDHRLILYAWLMCLITVASLSLYSIYCRVHWRQIVKFKIYKEKSLYKEIAVFNNYIALGAASYVGRAQGSNMMINYFFGTMVNGAFSIAYMIENYAMIIISNLTTAAGPRITKDYSSGDQQGAYIIAGKINRVSIMFMTIIVFMGNLQLPELLTLWLGTIPVGAVVLCRWTLISALARSLSEGLPPVIQASGKVKWFQISSSAAQLLTLIGGFILFRYGYPPQTIIICLTCTSLLNFIVSMWIMRIIWSKDMILGFLRGSVGKVMWIIMGAAAYYIANKYLFPDINIFLNLLAGFAYICALCVLFGLTYEERDILFGRMARRLPYMLRNEK